MPKWQSEHAKVSSGLDLPGVELASAPGAPARLFNFLRCAGNPDGVHSSVRCRAGPRISLTRLGPARSRISPFSQKAFATARARALVLTTLFINSSLSYVKLRCSSIYL